MSTNRSTAASFRNEIAPTTISAWDDDVRLPVDCVLGLETRVTEVTNDLRRPPNLPFHEPTVSAVDRAIVAQVGQNLQFIKHSGDLTAPLICYCYAFVYRYAFVR
jgi:hypothetical protein